MLRAEGHVINKRRVERLWREEGLTVPRGEVRCAARILGDYANIVFGDAPMHGLVDSLISGFTRNQGLPAQ